jgi:hypothetical protein
MSKSPAVQEYEERQQLQIEIDRLRAENQRYATAHKQLQAELDRLRGSKP